MGDVDDGELSALGVERIGKSGKLEMGWKHGEPLLEIKIRLARDD
jgi:hypothetical protein